MLTSSTEERKSDEPICIFSSLESALYIINLLSIGLRSETITDLPHPARLGIADLLKESCISGFDHLDNESSQDSRKEKTVIELVNAGRKSGKN